MYYCQSNPKFGVNLKSYLQVGGRIVPEDALHPLSCPSAHRRNLSMGAKRPWKDSIDWCRSMCYLHQASRTWLLAISISLAGRSPENISCQVLALNIQHTDDIASFLSRRTAPMSLTRDSSFGNTPMTFERRLNPLLRHSIWLDVRKYLWRYLGNTITVIASSKPSSKRVMAFSAMSL